MNYSRNKPRGGGGRPPYRKQFDRPKRAPLPEGFSLFYIAVSCPESINDKIESMKDYMERNYGCKAARKSPAHLTIVPPFRAEDELQSALLDFIATFNMGIVPFDITLKGFGQFAERVLFVDVEGPNDSLLQLEKECMQDFSAQFPGIIFGMKPDFNPHVTIATRDIPEGTLQTSKSYFEANHPMEEAFTAKELTLYRLENGWWKAV
jgi:2'-5' RNA ligase